MLEIQVMNTSVYKNLHSQNSTSLIQSIGCFFYDKVIYQVWRRRNTLLDHCQYQTLTSNMMMWALILWCRKTFGEWGPGNIHNRLSKATSGIIKNQTMGANVSFCKNIHSSQLGVSVIQTLGYRIFLQSYRIYKTKCNTLSNMFFIYFFVCVFRKCCVWDAIKTGLILYHFKPDSDTWFNFMIHWIWS